MLENRNWGKWIKFRSWIFLREASRLSSSLKQPTKLKSQPKIFCLQSLFVNIKHLSQSRQTKLTVHPGITEEIRIHWWEVVLQRCNAWYIVLCPLSQWVPHYENKQKKVTIVSVRSIAARGHGIWIHFATADELVREYMKFEYRRSSRLKWTYKSHKVRVALIILTQDLSWFVPDFPEPLKTHICPCLAVELKRNSFDNNHSLPHMVTIIFEGSYTKGDFQLLQEII